MIVGSGDIDSGEGKAGGDLEKSGLVWRFHAHERTGCDGGEGFGGMVDELHHNLRKSEGLVGQRQRVRGQHTRASTCTALMGESFRASAMLSGVEKESVVVVGLRSLGVLELIFAECETVCQDFLGYASA